MQLRYLQRLIVRLLCFSIPFFVGILVLAFTQSPKKYNTKELILRQIYEAEVQLDSLVKIASDYATYSADKEALKIQFTKARYAYKAVESYATYFYPKHTAAYINGAALDHLDPYPVGNAPTSELNLYLNSAPFDDLDGGYFIDGGVQILPPAGFQIIEELIFDADSRKQAERIYKLSVALKTKFKILADALTSRKFILDYQVLESSRLQLVRIMTLGITGFDSPIYQNSLNETRFSLISLNQVLQDLLSQTNNDNSNHIQRLFEFSISYLENKDDFEKFDRLYFIKNFIDPLYAQLLHLQKALNLKSRATITNETPSWNSNTISLFSEDFLNPYYYTVLTKEEDTPLLNELGKTIFYDEKLSSSQTISCASCHNPKQAYSDGQQTSSASIQGNYLERNAPSLINAVYADRYFYDMRVFDLENQYEHVFKNHLEYNTTYEDIAAKISASDQYTRFSNSIAINKYTISKALTSFLISLRSLDSEFDKYMRGEDDVLSAEVKNGFNLFMGKAKCATCHFPPTFSGLIPPLYQENESEVLGVLVKPNGQNVDTDTGRSSNGVYNENQNIYNKSFKTVSVRNASVTAPYFHNGTYQTLEQVLDFYNNGGGAGLGFSNEIPNQTLPSENLELTAQEMQELIAFIDALTDHSTN